uniref:Uncharacterized protein n=1 Tax=Tetranychus urticae TaxID=32264 RepID=T1JX27_TETUR
MNSYEDDHQLYVKLNDPRHFSTLINNLILFVTTFTLQSTIYSVVVDSPMKLILKSLESLIASSNTYQVKDPWLWRVKN